LAFDSNQALNLSSAPLPLLQTARARLRSYGRAKSWPSSPDRVREVFWLVFSYAPCPVWPYASTQAPSPRDSLKAWEKKIPYLSRGPLEGFPRRPGSQYMAWITSPAPNDKLAVAPREPQHLAPQFPREYTTKRPAPIFTVWASSSIISVGAC